MKTSVSATVQICLFQTPASALDLLKNVCYYPSRKMSQQVKVAKGDVISSKANDLRLPTYNELFLSRTYAAGGISESYLRVRAWMLPSPFSRIWHHVGWPNPDSPNFDQARHFHLEQMRARRSCGVETWPDALVADILCTGDEFKDLCEPFVRRIVLEGSAGTEFTASGRIHHSGQGAVHVPPLPKIAAYTAGNLQLFRSGYCAIDDGLPTHVGTNIPTLVEQLAGCATTFQSIIHAAQGAVLRGGRGERIRVIDRNLLQMEDNWVTREGGVLVGGTAVFPVEISENLRKRGMLEPLRPNEESIAFVLPEYLPVECRYSGLPEIVSSTALIELVREAVKDELSRGRDVLQAHVGAYKRLGFRADVVDKMEAMALAAWGRE